MAAPEIARYTEEVVSKNAYTTKQKSAYTVKGGWHRCAIMGDDTHTS